jgi:TIR domain
MPGFSSGGIFLSYRREDAAPYARLLKSELVERFPVAQVFMDLDSIEAGRDFAEAISEAVNSYAVLVALIGRQWVTLTDKQGRRRIDNPDDLVRFEIQTALERGVRVIPVLVDGAEPLYPQQLPAELGKLARLNALELSYRRYEYDAGRLIGLIQRVLAPPGETTGRSMLACSSLTAGHLEEFVLGEAGQLRHRWYWTDQNWSDWHDIPAPPTARITAIAAGSHSDRQQELIAAGADGSIHHRWNFLSDEGSHWSDWHTF